MAIKELKKNVKVTSQPNTKAVDAFIAKGGSLAEDTLENGDHRLSLRIPKYLIDKVDEKRKNRVGKISRNLWILELIERSTR